MSNIAVLTTTRGNFYVELDDTEDTTTEYLWERVAERASWLGGFAASVQGFRNDVRYGRADHYVSLHPDHVVAVSIVMSDQA